MTLQSQSPHHELVLFGRILLAGVVLACGVLAALPAFAQSNTASAEPIVFVPPVIGAPGNRVGAGTRSGEAASDGISLVAPKGGGLTQLESPVLYWWLDASFKGSVRIRLRADKSERPLLDLRENLSASQGLQSFDLARLGLRIRDRQIYQWSVTLRPAGNGKPRRAATFLERQAAVVLAETVDNATAARILASKGIWFDAFARTARDPSLTGYRDALMKQAGIKTIAK